MIVTFMDELDSIFHKYIEVPKSAFYHYTTIEAAKSISKNKNIKMNSHKVLNEKNPNNAELIYAERIILRILSCEFKFCKIKNKLKASFREYIKNGICVDTASFCDVNDSTHAFEKYADLSKGVCIGFKKPFFDHNEADNYRNGCGC